MQDEYRSIAPVYDPLLSPFFRGVRRGVADYLAGIGAHRVLDLCCGTGEQIRVLADRGMLALGLDLSPAMLEKAKTRARCNGRVACLLGDAANPPLKAGKVDAVVACMALHEMEQEVRDKAFATMRKLAPVLVVVDYAATRPGNRPPAGTLLARRICHIPERLAGERHYAAYKDFMARGGVDGLFDESGLKPSFRKDFLFATLRLLASDLRDLT